MAAIKVEDLTKEFDGLTAVDHISFSVRDGEIFGLLGPNGAGKTTTINMLATLLRVTTGRAEVAGHDVLTEQEAVRRSIGIVFQEPALDTELTGKENLEFHAMMYGMKKEEREKRIAEVLDIVELADKQDVIVRNYSGGMKRRLEIARGLIHWPKVLFLDEPTLGLDAQTRRRIWEYIKKLNKEANITIILTSHYMEEADYLCDRIAIIDHGKIVALDTSKELKDILGGDIVSLEVASGADRLAERLKKLKWVKTIKHHDGKMCDGTLCLTMEKGEKRIPDLINIAQKMKIKVVSVNLRKPSLEDVFLHFTGKTIREREATQRERNIAARRMMGGRR
jgi:ABC-2 type transport system ATP-binding protein